MFTVCDGQLCISEAARVPWTKYYLALRNWAEDAEQLCGEDI